MSSTRAPAGVVLTGGASKRMGVDKAFVVVDGAPMVVRVADALWEAGCHPVECQGGDGDAIGRLGLQRVADLVPGAGPASAILEALRRHGGPIVVAACDLPALDAATVGAVIDAGRAAGIATAASDGERHLLSYWSGDAVAALQAALDDGLDSYRAVLERVGAVDVAVPSASMRNVNRPDEVT